MTPPSHQGPAPGWIEYLAWEVWNRTGWRSLARWARPAEWASAVGSEEEERAGYAYAGPRKRARRKLERALADLIRENVLTLQWLEQLHHACDLEGVEPFHPDSEGQGRRTLEYRHAGILKRVRSFEAALAHVVELELRTADDAEKPQG